MEATQEVRGPAPAEEMEPDGALLLPLPAKVFLVSKTVKIVCGATPPPPDAYFAPDGSPCSYVLDIPDRGGQIVAVWCTPVLTDMSGLGSFKTIQVQLRGPHQPSQIYLILQGQCLKHDRAQIVINCLKTK